MPALSERKIVEVCYAPSHFPLYDNGFDIVVVIDVLRATSAITTGLHCGIKEIIPINSVEKAVDYKSKGYITAAERDGQVVEGFDFGNRIHERFGVNRFGDVAVRQILIGSQNIIWI